MRLIVSLKILWEIYVIYCSIGNKCRNVKRCRKKWSDFKNKTTVAWHDIQTPKTGGGKPKTLTNLQQELIDFLIELGSLKVSGIEGGLDTMEVMAANVSIFTCYRKYTIDNYKSDVIFVEMNVALRCFF